MYYVLGDRHDNIVKAIADAQLLCCYLDVGETNDFVCVTERGLVVALVQYEDIYWYNAEARKVYEDFINEQNN